MNLASTPRWHLVQPLMWLGFFVVLLCASQLANAGRFGTECQRDYQNGWRATLDHSWERCSWFNDELNDTDTQVYYYDLHGAKPWWENTNELDQVNLVTSTPTAVAGRTNPFGLCGIRLPVLIR